MLIQGILFFKILFLYLRERERQRAHLSRGRGRGSSRLLSEQGALDEVLPQAPCSERSLLLPLTLPLLKCALCLSLSLK